MMPNLQEKKEKHIITHNYGKYQGQNTSTKPSRDMKETKKISDTTSLGDCSAILLLVFSNQIVDRW